MFRGRLNPLSKKLGSLPMDSATIYRLIQGYLKKLPGAMKEVKTLAGRPAKRCIYTPHSLRATTATLLLDAGVDIRKPGSTGAPARHHDAGLRQAAQEHVGKCVRRCADLG